MEFSESIKQTNKPPNVKTTSPAKKIFLPWEASHSFSPPTLQMMNSPKHLLTGSSSSLSCGPALCLGFPLFSPHLALVCHG